RKVRTF
ncbi:DNA gyrase, A subunit, partial [Chlamydia psittaci 03DC29]